MQANVMLKSWLSRLFSERSPHADFPNVEIDPTASLRLTDGTDRIGCGSLINAYCELSSALGGNIVVGQRCEIGRGAIVATYGGNIKIGDDCSINPYCVIYGHGGLSIGNHVRIATHSVIIPANHNFSRTDIPIYQQGLSKRGVIIEDDVWVGAHAVITDGVRIGKGAIIGAGAVVTDDIDRYAICAGVPARIIGRRGSDATAEGGLHGGEG